MTDANRLTRLIAIFATVLGESHRTRLVGGFSEPFYRAPRGQEWGEIRFRDDYLSSCLHELAHWLVAGAERRKQDDFGYWYAPDGRTSQQQAAFFAAEVKPQAMEWALAEAYGTSFQLSVDNLDGGPPPMAELNRFSQAVAAQKVQWAEKGFPHRAAKLITALQQG